MDLFIIGDYDVCIEIKNGIVSYITSHKIYIQFTFNRNLLHIILKLTRKKNYVDLN